MASIDPKQLRSHPIYQSSSATITLSKGEGEMDDQTTRFCDEIKRLAPQITIKKESDNAFEGPAMIVGRHSNIAYYGVPSSKILALFLDALNFDHPPPTNEKALVDQQINLPVALKLYVADQCPNCPQVLRQIQKMAALTPMVRLKVINAQLFTEKASSDQIRSVPTLILDDQFRWIGQVDPQELLKLCSDRDPSTLSADSLKQLVENGDAARVATMMVDSDQVFPAFVELFTHPRWSVRLGAMVSAEYLADETPELTQVLCDQLWNQFSELTPQIQGDVTHLFGLLDTDATRANLETIASGAFDEEVKAAAAEVLEEMDQIEK